MAPLDMLILVVYVGGLFVVGMCVGVRENAEDFLVFSRRAPFVLVMFSVVSTWVGAGTTVATASAGYQTGISVGLTACIGGLVGVVAAGVFAPTIKSFGDRYRAHTIGDFFGIRYSPAARYIAGGLIVFVYILLTAGQLVAIASLVKVWVDTRLEWLLAAAAITTVVYTAFAGMKSDFYTDIVHFFVMIGVFFGVLMPAVGFGDGAFGAIGKLPRRFFDPFAYGGISFFCAGIIFGVGMVFVTMELWQRIYASSSNRAARWALVSSGVVIIAFYVLSALIGMVARALDLPVPDADQALFIVMKRFLPKGFLGLGLAAFLAVIISTVNSLIMVASAALTKDFYKTAIWPEASDRHLLWAGRAVTLVVGSVALVCGVLIQDVVVLTVNSMFILLCLLPSLMGGFFWRGSTSTGCVLSIAAGIAVTLGLSLVKPNEAFVPGFLVALLVFISASKLSKHAATETIQLLNNEQPCILKTLT